MNKESTEYRQAKIKELLASELITDQNRLVELLKAEGIETNQAVISRDFRKLGVIKKPRNDLMVYEVPDIDVQIEILKLGLVDVIHNETTIVIKTQPGLAAFVGDCLDQHPELDIIGCLAGENVVFVAPKSVKNIEKVCEAICKKFQFKKVKRSHVK